MSILKWAAVAVTSLMGLMNLGLALDPEFSTSWRVAGAVLFAIAVIAVVGLARNLSWGRAAAVAIGAANVAGAVFGAVDDQEGWMIGLIVAALGALLAGLHHVAPATDRVPA